MSISNILRLSLGSEWVHLGNRNGAEFWSLSNSNSWDESDLLKIDIYPNSDFLHIEILLSNKRNSNIMNRRNNIILYTLNEINKNSSFIGKMLVSNGTIRYEYITPQSINSTGLAVSLIKQIKTAYTHILDL